MQGLLKCIFKPHDGTRKVVKDQVTASREKVESAVNRFEATIRDLLNENDTITGRRDGHANQHHQ